MRKRGKFITVFDEKLGYNVQSQYPTTREEAAEENIVHYMPIPTVDHCPRPHHRSIHYVWYTKTGLRKCCAIEDADMAYATAVNSGEPTTAKEARDQGKDYYWSCNPGDNCGHVGKMTLNGRCYACTHDKPAKVMSPRQYAISQGHTWYAPHDNDPCPAGHVALRRVSNGSCMECESLRGKPPVDQAPPLWKSAPDLIISRGSARELGFNVFRTGKPCRYGHTGFRYVSTGGCIVCMGRE